MNRSSAGLMAEVYPDVEVRGELGEFETLLSIGKARRLLGYEPAYLLARALSVGIPAAQRRCSLCKHLCGTASNAVQSVLWSRDHPRGTSRSSRSSAAWP